MGDINELIHRSLNGGNPFERIVHIECGYMDDKATLIYYDANMKKRSMEVDYKPFLWAKNSICIQMCGGDREKLKRTMHSYGISVKKLTTSFQDDGKTHERVENGYKFMFYTNRRMSYNRFLSFFSECGTPIYNNKKDSKDDEKGFLAISPIEQFMISNGIRLYKGFENYDDLKRLVFDLETQGLNPRIHAIDQIGIRTNKGYENIITIKGDTPYERRINELNAISEFLQIVKEENADVVCGYNSENFDWDFIIVRCEVLGTSIKELCDNLGYAEPIYKKKKESVLKLGGEVEYYRQTIMYGTPIIDGLHAVRRAQAIDSNMKSANLKYITKYSSLNKKNRVYVPGDKITSTWNVTNLEYAFNEENGDWYKITEKKPLAEGYRLESGKYIVERYLLDDLYETDKVELRYNEPNFLLCKLLPTIFQKACTMGTAGTWKLIMLAWSYEYNLAIPDFAPKTKFTGGLSRLLRVGYANNIVKLDYNSLYPSIILTYGIRSELDISGGMLSFLEYILTEREKFKGLKKKASKQKDRVKGLLEDTSGLSKEEIDKLKEELQHWESEANSYDKKQLPFKIFGNSFFGAYGAPNIYNWGDLMAAENTCCVGRQMLRLMISHFKEKCGYTPLVGDSFLGDTPLFIKYEKTGMIDIKPIADLINTDAIEVDALGREYDYSKKKYKVLCRSGWCDVSYIYRHKTDKDIYSVEDGDMSVEVTEDHSLFNSDKVEIKPSEINENTKLEYYDKNSIIQDCKNNKYKDVYVKFMAMVCGEGKIDHIPCNILNASVDNIKLFLECFEKYNKGKEVSLKTKSKTFISGMLFIKNKVEYYKKGEETKWQDIN